MKYMRQFLIIMIVTFIGELLRYLIPLNIPSSIYGLCLMLFLLFTKIVKLEQVKETSLFLIEIMPLMFIPTTVGIIVYWEELQKMLIPLVVISIISTIIVMVVSGRLTQFIIRRKSNDGINK